MLASSPRPYVLIADDDSEILELLACVLTYFGMEPGKASDGTNAVALFASNPLGFDVAILDHHMPRLGGIEAAIAIREMAPSLPIVISSAYMDEKTRRQLAPLSGVTVLEKPFQLRDLRAALTSSLVPA